MGILIFSLIKIVFLQSETEQVGNMYQALSEQAQATSDNSVPENTEAADTTSDSTSPSILSQYTDFRRIPYRYICVNLQTLYHHAYCVRR